MKKTLLVSCLLILIALLVSARWGTKADDAPPSDTLGTPDTTLAVALSLEDMVNQSDVIAIGNCVDTKSIWVDQSLVTLATVSVSETIKGATESGTVTVVLPGGIDANRKFPVAMSYPGAPRLTPGEDVFLFLTSDTGFAGGYNVAGFSQGKFSIVNDEDGTPVVSRDLTKMSLQGNNGVRRGGANVTPLSTFKDQVRGYMKTQ
ncbi:MAG TPA: hypothetical protein VFH46_21150 [Pyrinomonadaceae bacterium]|nr:hypothetical protein [Pyrinomonadaceae bacterium]